LNRKLAKARISRDWRRARYHYTKPGRNEVANAWMDFSTIRVSLEWNLWRWQQDRHRVEAAEVEYHRLTLEERELLRSIDYEVERSWEDANFAAKQIQLAGRLLAQQQERYRIVSAQQREGVATTNDVVVAEADLTQAELQLQRR
jgi:outer membrane protein TolC